MINEPFFYLNFIDMLKSFMWATQLGSYSAKVALDLFIEAYPYRDITINGFNGRKIVMTAEVFMSWNIYLSKFVDGELRVEGDDVLSGNPIIISAEHVKRYMNH